MFTDPDLIGNVEAGDGAPLLGGLDPGGRHHWAVVTRGLRHVIQASSVIRRQERCDTECEEQSPVIDDHLASLVHSTRNVSEYPEVSKQCNIRKLTYAGVQASEMMGLLWAMTKHLGMKVAQ